MAKFRFAFQRVLEYRELQEGWAKDAFLEARSRRLQAEAEADRIVDLIDKTEHRLPRDLQEMKTIESYIEKLSIDLENQRSVVAILIADEESAHAEWVETRKKLKTMEKLRELAREEWALEQSRAEQRELDEWTSLRRLAS